MGRKHNINVLSVILLGGTMQPCMVEKTEYFCKDTHLDGAGLQKFGAFVWTSKVWTCRGK
jgi:hypothetical protein